MSVSKLESLPNEILVDILEKYINGVDMLIAFAQQQNQRFNALLAQCRRLQFNFISCRKDDFHFYLRLLPAYIANIEKLVLSEQNTPGQIHLFFSFFPSFTSFTRLRKLYLNFDAQAVEWEVVQTALLSLSNITIDTLSIKVISTNNIPTLHQVIADILLLPTLKRFSIYSSFQRIQWDFLENISSNIEYLTIAGIRCEFQHLQSVFRCVPRLKYLDVLITCPPSYDINASTDYRKIDIISMPTLITLFLSFQIFDLTTFDMLAQYLAAMPALRRLEIKSHNTLLKASAWETFLQTSLPFLMYFTLQTTTTCIENGTMDNILALFETPFWIEKENFYMIITERQQLNTTVFGTEYMQAATLCEYDLPVTRWWTVPMRSRIDGIFVNKITSLDISGVASFLSLYNYFNNIDRLGIFNLDESLLEWIKIHVNFSRIRCLDTSHLKAESNLISSLLSWATNISTLRIQYQHLLAHQSVYVTKENHLKFLDISSIQHTFYKQDIITISRLFPNIEHLAINTTHLSNVPLLQTYLPHLCSLTYTIMDSQFALYYLDQTLWDAQLRQIVRFSFQRRKDYVKVWIDQNALKEPYWKQFALDSSRFFNQSMTTTFFNRIFSFFE